MNALFLEPLDVLFLRGNKLFGDPGSHGESLVPPWPSVGAGALRSRMLIDAGIDPAAFARGEVEHAELGTPDKPGAFAVTAFHLARRQADGSVEVLFQTPADLVITEDVHDKPEVKRLVPTRLPGGAVLQSSAPLPLLPVLAERERSKPASGYWLTEAGWKRYLRDETPAASELVKSDKLWSSDHRVGVGLEAATRRAAEGRLFSVQAVAMRTGVGFLAAVEGATPPKEGTLRLGGDGRAAAIYPVEKTLPEPDYEGIARDRCCRILLTTPGIFTAGWLPNGAKPDERREDGAVRFELAGVSGWIVAAAVPRFEVVSGWDLAKWQPKPAQRAAPTGSVWWLEELDATPEALRKLAAQGLWSEPCEDVTRRAEGFNRFTFAAY
jgi:CRISPR-associated protein Cmr3